MKIALIVTDLAPARIGGISRVATELGANLASLGHHVVAYVLERGPDSAKREYRGIDIRYIEPFPTPNRDYPVVGFSHRAFARLVADARHEAFDLVHSFNLNAIALPRFAPELRAQGIKLAVSSFETIMMDVKAKLKESLSLLSLRTVPQIIFETYLALAHERRYIGAADAVFTEDENTRDALTRIGIHKARIHVIPSGVDLEASRAASPPKIDLENSGPRIGYVGRADPRKGVQYLLSAMAVVLRRHPDASLFMAGGSRQGYDRTLRRMIDRLELEKHVHLLGRIEGNVLPYYKLADVIVIPSLSEGIPITLGEAMASERPVVITRLPGVVPFVSPPDLVYWADLADAGSLADAIIAALEDPGRSERVSRALTFISNFSWADTAKRHAEVYQQMLKA